MKGQSSLSTIVSQVPSHATKHCHTSLFKRSSHTPWENKGHCGDLWTFSSGSAVEDLGLRMWSRCELTLMEPLVLVRIDVDEVICTFAYPRTSQDQPQAELKGNHSEVAVSQPLSN